jgi:hypothetical protein
LRISPRSSGGISDQDKGHAAVIIQACKIRNIAQGL